MKRSPFRTLTTVGRLFGIEYRENLKPIKIGKQTALVFHGRRGFPLGPVTLGSSLSGEGVYVRITHLHVLHIRDLCLSDAQACGFAKLKNLRSYIERTWPTARVGDEVTKIHFEFCGDVRPKEKR